MARIVGMKHSDFYVKKLKKTFSKNSGKEITTDDNRYGNIDERSKKIRQR